MPKNARIVYTRLESVTYQSANKINKFKMMSATESK